MFLSIAFVVLSVAHVALPQKMAVMGDSISEAMLSEYSIERPPGTSQILQMINLATTGEGDLIDRFRKAYAKPKHSWATGDDEADIVLSHFERLKEFQPDIEQFNFAVSGSESIDIPKQAQQILDYESKTGRVIDYVVLLVGANDLRREHVADILSPLEFVGNVEYSLRKLLNYSSDRRILLMGLPKIHEVFEESENLEAAKLFGREFKCGTIRRTLYGPSVIFMPELGAAYEETKQIVKQYDQGLIGLASRLQEDYARSSIKIVSGYSNPSLVLKTLSVDCFHPSLWGQAVLAEVSWQLGFWPELDASFGLE